MDGEATVAVGGWMKGFDRRLTSERLGGAPSKLPLPCGLAGWLAGWLAGGAGCRSFYHTRAVGGDVVKVRWGGIYTRVFAGRYYAWINIFLGLFLHLW